MIFHITHVYIFPHLQEEGNLLDQCARVHVFKSRIISSACFHPDDDVHWGKANFAHTPAFQRFEGVFTRTHVYIQQIVKATGNQIIEAHLTCR